MPQVIITGAGPMGLHLALMLVNNNLPAKEIIIIDPRAERYMGQKATLTSFYC